MNARTTMFLHQIASKNILTVHFKLHVFLITRKCLTPCTSIFKEYFGLKLRI
jgi:hypothetical protein